MFKVEQMLSTDSKVLLDRVRIELVQEQAEVMPTPATV